MMRHCSEKKVWSNGVVRGKKNRYSALMIQKRSQNNDECALYCSNKRFEFRHPPFLRCWFAVFALYIKGRNHCDSTTYTRGRDLEFWDYETMALRGRPIRQHYFWSFDTHKCAWKNIESQIGIDRLHSKGNLRQSIVRMSTGQMNSVRERMSDHMAYATPNKLKATWSRYHKIYTSHSFDALLGQLSNYMIYLKKILKGKPA